MMDFCQNPQLKRIHGALGIDYFGRSPSELRPLFVLSKFANNAEFVITPLEAYHNFSTKPELDNLTWEDKIDDRLFWRGSSTGGLHGLDKWERSHRMRLHLMMNGRKGKEGEMSELEKEVMMPDGNGGFEMRSVDMKTLNDAYMDVALGGRPVQVRSRSRGLHQRIFVD